MAIAVTSVAGNEVEAVRISLSVASSAAFECHDFGQVSGPLPVTSTVAILDTSPNSHQTYRDDAWPIRDCTAESDHVKIGSKATELSTVEDPKRVNSP